ncbi:MFS transporter [Rhodococcus kroppenstedtii]|uniref:MFS transporter n=1 Tax=Rhodococcoides kroppenstedtii TaxID=293050 RepID=UPI001C9A5349|nr:MFS transporter [Rhodococcus kroppenstedtii]MBY6437752.1 MFS transporter [Rhodococcus kroppenstedtii]
MWRSIGRTRTASPVPYGWAPAVVLVLVSLVDRMEYSLVSAVLPQLQAEWGFGDAVAGSIPTAAAITTGLLAVPAAYLADRYDRGRIITVVVLVWALATVGSALAPTFAVFYLVRMGLAAAEAIDNPASASLLADFHPSASRPTAFGWWRTAAYLGGAGIVLGGVLAEWLGWRGAFLVMALPGLATAVLVSRLHEPERGWTDRLTAGVVGGGATEPARDPGTLRTQWRRLVSIRTLWGTGAALTVMSLAVGGLTFWAPSLLQRRFGLGDGAAAAAGGGLTLIGVVAGTLVGAALTRRSLAPTPAQWRVVVGGVGILGGTAAMTAALAVEGVLAFCVLLTLFAFLAAWALPTLTSCVADVLPAQDRGLGYGALQIGATVGGAIGPLLVGAVSEAADSLTVGMVPLLPLLVMGGVLALCAYPFVAPDAQRVLDAAGAP